jgi:hypothetical protein
MQFAYKAVGFPGMAISGQKMTGRHMLFGDAIILQKCINSLYPFHQPFSNTLQVALHRSFFNTLLAACHRRRVQPIP